MWPETPLKMLGPVSESRSSFPIPSSSSSNALIANIESTVSKSTSEMVGEKREICNTGYVFLVSI